MVSLCLCSYVIPVPFLPMILHSSVSASAILASAFITSAMLISPDFQAFLAKFINVADFSGEVS